MAIYNNDILNQEVRLIDFSYLPYITGMYMDHSEIPITSSYTFPSTRRYAIYFYMDISSLNSLSYMFDRVRQIVSIYFTRIFDTKNINNMDYMFYYSGLNSIDVSNFNT